MLLMALKIASGLCAVVVAVIAALELPLTSRSADDFRTSRWRRLSVAGWVNLACAVATFLLVGLSGVLDYDDDQKKTTETKAQYDRIVGELTKSQATLEETRLAVGQSQLDAASLAQDNEYLLRTADQSIVRSGVARLPIIDSSGTGDPLKFTGGMPIVPKRDDMIEWRMACLREVPSMEQMKSGMCRELGYGRLLANGSSIVLNKPSGQGTLFGTRSTGGVLEYRNPSEDASCMDFTKKMEEAACELQLYVWTEAKWRFEELKSQHRLDRSDLDKQDACRRYTALYGETCEQAIERLRKK